MDGGQVGTTPKIGVVGTNGGWSSEKLADVVYEATGYRLLINMEHVCLDLSTGKAWYKDVDLTRLDALMVKKIGSRYSPDLLDRLEVLRYLSRKGLKIFSRPSKMMKVLDRLSCTITLQLADIPMPPTTITEDCDAALRMVEQYGEAIFKPLYTSKAKGMIVIQSGADAKSAIEEFHADNPIMYIQKKIDLKGKDLGLAFLGGKYITTYARCNTGSSWNTTTANGGKYAAYQPSPETIDIAIKAQSLFDLDFTCVDVAETDEGPYVFEVSAFGGFRGIQTAAGMDAAKLYVNYVLDKLSEEK